MLIIDWFSVMLAINASRSILVYSSSNRSLLVEVIFISFYIIYLSYYLNIINNHVVFFYLVLEFLSILNMIIISMQLFTSHFLLFFINTYIYIIKIFLIKSFKNRLAKVFLDLKTYNSSSIWLLEKSSYWKGQPLFWHK